MIEFLHAGWLWLLFPLVALQWLVPRRPVVAAAPAALVHPFIHWLPSARVGAGNSARWLWLLPLGAHVLIVLALAQPRWQGPPQSGDPEGRDLVLLVDVSKSMSINDFKAGDQPVERLTVLKHWVTRFIDRRRADRVSLIAFANQAATVVPPTHDRAFVNAMLDRVSVGMLGDDTAIGDAIGLALKQLSPAKHRPALILFGDGDNTAGALSPGEAIVLARRQGASVYTVEIGGDLFAEGRSAPAASSSVMPELARETGGRYYRVTDTAAFERVMRDIDALEKIVAPTQGPVTGYELYLWPLLLAAFLLSVHAWHIGRHRGILA